MKCDHIELYKLIEKCVLKQTSSKYPYLIYGRRHVKHT